MEYKEKYEELLNLHNQTLQELERLKSSDKTDYNVDDSKQLFMLTLSCKETHLTLIANLIKDQHLSHTYF